MREMTEDEMVLYNILKNNQTARNSNWEAVREFYWQRYMINLPKLSDTLTIWTVERMIRTLKSMYKECTDDASNAIKMAEEEKFKEAALDRNKPIKPQLEKTEEIKLLVVGNKSSKNCCYKCKRREVGCHAHCEDYLKFVEYNKKLNEEIRLGKKYSGDTNWNYYRGDKNGNR